MISPRSVGPETMILPVLNGMRHIDLLAKRFGEHAVIGGVCLVAAETDDQGRVVQLADVQRLVYGERNGDSTPRLKTLDATLQGAGFDARLSPDIMQEMWEKWVQLASLGAITCLMRGTIGEIVAAPGGAELSIDVLNESAAVATACGYRPPEKMLSRHATAMTAPGSSLTSSMYRDLRKGAPVEADHILGDFIERGSAHGVATALLKVALVDLCVYQDRLLSIAVEKIFPDRTNFRRHDVSSLRGGCRCPRRERGSHERSNARPEQLDRAQHFRVRQCCHAHLERDTGNAA